MKGFSDNVGEVLHLLVAGLSVLAWVLARFLGNTPENSGPTATVYFVFGIVMITTLSPILVIWLFNVCKRRAQPIAPFHSWLCYLLLFGGLCLAATAGLIVDASKLAALPNYPNWMGICGGFIAASLLELGLFVLVALIDTYFYKTEMFRPFFLPTAYLVSGEALGWYVVDMLDRWPTDSDIDAWNPVWLTFRITCWAYIRFILAQRENRELDEETEALVQKLLKSQSV